MQKLPGSMAGMHAVLAAAPAQHAETLRLQDVTYAS